jgi:pimeloyl-ACP methyl ester carboxylesterase/putative sterol carrier protein
MTVTAALHDRGADLDVLLASRLRRSLVGSTLEQRVARVVFDAGHSQWTVELDRGRSRVRRGTATSPTLVVRGTPSVLADVIAGQASGVQAFLDGDITVRGDLGLSLELDGLFGEVGRSETFPRAKQTHALGVRTAYLEAGPADAPPVVLLHGLGATNASLLPCLADLARDHRVLAPDLPGFGNSSAPRAAYSFPWFAAWLEDFQRTVGARPAVLLGNSLGGRIAIEAGLTRPGSVRALALLTPSPAFRRMRRLIPLVSTVMRPQLGRIPFPMSHRAVVQGLRVMFSDPDRLARPWYDAAADEAIRVLRSPAHRQALLACGRQILVEEAHGRNGFWDRLPALGPPALFLWGDHDRLVPSAFARHVENALPDATSIVLEDSGHVPQFEHPELTMRLVRDFLGGLQP